MRWLFTEVANRHEMVARFCAMLRNAVWYTDIRKQVNTKQQNKGDKNHEKEQEEH